MKKEITNKVLWLFAIGQIGFLIYTAVFILTSFCGEGLVWGIIWNSPAGSISVMKDGLSKL